jgi:signal transduction histidine kinase
MEVKTDALQQQLHTDQQLKILGQMSAVLGHELKNTVASLKGNAQLLVEKSPDNPVADAVATEAAYLQELTTQMLEFTKTGALKKDKVYLDDLLDSAVDFSRAADVSIDIITKTTVVYIDRNKIQQCITNLLNNADSAAPRQPIKIVASGDQQMRIEVIDSGPGIPPETEHNIFEPFFTTRAKGFGLGLAFVKNVVEAHGGTVYHRSNPAGGAIFGFEIPVAPVRRTSGTGGQNK